MLQKEKSGQISVGLAVAHTANGALGGALRVGGPAAVDEGSQQHSHVMAGWCGAFQPFPSSLPSSATSALLQPLQGPRG